MIQLGSVMGLEPLTVGVGTSYEPSRADSLNRPCTDVGPTRNRPNADHEPARISYMDLDKFLFPTYKEKRNKAKHRESHRLKIVDSKLFCELCLDIPGREKLNRHRIIDLDGPYTNENVRILCQPCHGRIHRIINKLKKNGEIIDNNIVLLMAKPELDK